MKVFFYGFLVFCGALSCLALEPNFGEICSVGVNADDCLDYEQRGLAYVICRWWHFFPSLRDLDLITQKNPVYIFSQPYCDAWLKSKPSSLIPDVEGNYCKDNQESVDPKKLLSSDPQRALLCAKHAQAENYLRAKALSTIATAITNFSPATIENLKGAREYFEHNNRIIKQEYSKIFALEYSFPGKERGINWPRTSSWWW